eukprot:TRINITY_DN294_c0_g1_i1.p1 TRINITY_DN294_c0_g1~~TRINITY_DN294_c0_g1_i1.p1  ORF type:complete len:1674 (-),score=432.23 TRINITY_DN294_c0_g1_i1:61-4824(-)
MQHTFQVTQDGVPVEVDHDVPVFHGYAVDDHSSIMAIAFPSLNDEDLTPQGMVHLSTGEHRMFVHTETHGLSLRSIEKKKRGEEEVPFKCDTKDGDEHEHDHEHEQIEFEEFDELLGENVKFVKVAPEVIKKRNSQFLEELAQNSVSNGIGTPALLQIELVVQSDQAFAKLFTTVQAATTYIRAFFSVINTIYERDIRASLVVQHFAYNPSSSPVTNLDDLNTWLKANPNVGALADLATVLNGAGSGGLGYVGTVCKTPQTSHSGVNGLWGTTSWSAPNDVIVTAHELGHTLGSPHTHDPNGYSPVIDACGSNQNDPSVVPSGGGSIMSYCHVVKNNGWSSINLFMGGVGKYGVNSERVNIKIRSILENGQCLTSTDPTWAPACSDVTAYTWSDGSAINCATEAAKSGYCDSKVYMAAPYCMKSCKRCKTTTTPVVPIIPYTTAATNCEWSAWSAYGQCSVPCGGGTQTSTRTIAVTAANGGSDCTGATSQTQKCNTQACPVDCVLGDWSAWGSCSASCGGGTQTQSRSVVTAAANGGAACTGATSQSQKCNTQACPVNCVLGDWSAWGSCSASCGGGTQTQTRSVVTAAANGGAACTGATSQSQKCNTQACPVDCVWSAWSAWGSCSASCGTGSQTATRSIVTAAANGGKGCVDESSKTQACNTQACGVDCQWSDWSAWGECSVSCGVNGVVTRTRSVAVAASGAGVACKGDKSETQSCPKIVPCPVDCIWDEWTQWSQCTAQCGTGSTTRTREVGIPAANGGAECTGESSSTTTCNTQACASTPNPPPPAPVAVDCQWSEWEAWSSCDKTCGTGSRNTKRSVVTYAANGGAECSGASTKSETCNTTPCPVDCVWGAWSAYGACSVTCGTGVATSTRSVSVASKNGGAACTGESSRTQSCTTPACPTPVDCKWNEWSAWDSCSAKCGGGTQSSTRTVAVTATNGGAVCSGETLRTQKCNTAACPTDCVWAEWTAWSACTASCGGGTQSSTRGQTAATNGGAACSGASSRSQSCNTNGCPVNCAWSAWSAWSTCSKTCGTGSQTKTRTVATAAANGGSACSGATSQTQSCNTQACPVNCVWGAWSAWSTCTATCGSGTTTSTRVITTQAANGGTACTGSGSQTTTCNTQACPTATCTDVANPSWTRNGLPINCTWEAIAGQCDVQSFNKSPYCKKSCSWDGCPQPACDDIPNPLVTFTVNGAPAQTTCAQQAAWGYCSASWMHARACRISCGRCGSRRSELQIPDVIDPSTSVEVLDPGSLVLDATVLFDQGSICVANKGMPSTRYVETETGARAADDFVVPAGETWSLGVIQVMGNWFKDASAVQDAESLSGSVPFTVTIFHNGNIQCKTTVPVLLPVPQVITLDISKINCKLIGAYENVDSSILVADQTYYITVSPKVDVTNQFYWSFSKSTNGETFQWRDTKDLFGLSKCPTWTKGDECGIPTAGTDLCFKLLGSKAVTSEADRTYMGVAQTSQTSEGIGNDAREGGVAWSPEQEAEEERVTAILRANAKLILEDLGVSTPEETSISEASDIKIESEEREKNDAWILPVAIVAAIAGTALIVGVIAVITHQALVKKGPAYKEVV